MAALGLGLTALCSQYYVFMLLFIAAALTLIWLLVRRGQSGLDRGVIAPMIHDNDDVGLRADELRIIGVNLALKRAVGADVDFRGKSSAD